MWTLIRNELTDTQVSSICKSFPKNSSVNVKLSKPRLFKVIQSKGLLDRLLGLVMKVSLRLMKNVLIALGKSLLIPIGLTEASASDAGIHKNN